MKMPASVHLEAAFLEFSQSSHRGPRCGGRLYGTIPCPTNTVWRRYQQYQQYIYYGLCTPYSLPLPLDAPPLCLARCLCLSCLSCIPHRDRSVTLLWLVLSPIAWLPKGSGNGSAGSSESWPSLTLAPDRLDRAARRATAALSAVA